uniref:Uncharacterized protein n=1 Tax=Lepeophtheirus salmonis TaxID=72036 RepID=A0A0K2TI43_LEPSM
MRGFGPVVKGRVIGECVENCKAQWSLSNLKL